MPLYQKQYQIGQKANAGAIEIGSEVLSGEDINLKKIILGASKGAITGTGAGLLVTAASNGLIDSTGNAIEKIN